MTDIQDTQSVPPVGDYHYVPGGITNQKLALFGMIVEALETRAREIILPDLLVFDQSHNHAFLPPAEMLKQWWDYFDPGPVHAFLAELGLRVVEGERVLGKFGGRFFQKALAVIQQAEIEAVFNPDHLICRFARSLVPYLRASPLLAEVKARAFHAQERPVVLQLRVETDWHRYAQSWRPGTPTYFDCVDIVRRVVRTLGIDRLVIACDEKHLPVPLPDLRQELETKTDAMIRFKSDFIPDTECNRLNLLELSLIDFGLAIACDRFVGMSVSAFSSAIALERFAQRRGRHSGDFVYDVPGSAIAERTDGGAFQTPELAAKEYYWEHQKAFWLTQTWAVVSGNRKRQLELYRLRMELRDETHEEFFVSALRVAQLLEELGAPDSEIVEAYELSIRSAPNRAEGYHGLSRHYRLVFRPEEGYQIAKRALDLEAPSQRRFVDEWVYEYGLLDEFAVNAYWSGHFVDCAEACTRMLSVSSLPDSYRDRVTENRRQAQLHFVGT